MKILAIETSCDDTGIAIISCNNTGAKVTEKKFKVLTNTLASQTEIHKKWGGVVPMLAKREHQKNLISLFRKAIEESNLSDLSNISLDKKKEKIQNFLKKEKDLYQNLEQFLKSNQIPKFDAIAVTKGPGLDPCLWVGVNLAKALSFLLDIPIIPINHIEAHIYSSLIKKDHFTQFSPGKKINFPAISLIVSGGHTQLILIKKWGNYKILGETRDDAAGECFDKIAKLLGLEYPGGPKIAQEAKKWGKETSFSFPRPMLKHDNLDFSFSGLKTAVLYHLKELKELDEETKKEIAYEAQEAITDALTVKTIKAIKEYKIKTLIIGGGVSANQKLRNKIKNKIDASVELILPLPKMSTDNALMVGITAFYKYNKNKITDIKKLKADPNLRLKQ